MSQTLHKCQSAMLGHAIANNFQAATYMAIELSKSLQILKQFDHIDVMSRYLFLRDTSEYHMGEVLEKVYENLISDTNATTKDKFQFSLSRIHQATQWTHQQLRGLTSGCNPAQRSYPLALCPKIDDEKLFEISYAEAQLTHLNRQAGQVSGIINLILRRLIRDDSWEQAIDFAFEKAPSNLAGDIREIHERYPDDHLLSPHTDPAYAPSVLLATLYCVNEADSYEDAFRDKNGIDKTYCQTLIGLLAGARWGIPVSILENSHVENLSVLKKLGNKFNRDWERQSGKTDGIIDKVMSLFFSD